MKLNRRHLLATGLAALAPLPARAGDDVVRIPFRYYRSRLPVVDVTLDGEGPFPFTFSTSAIPNTVHWELAHRLELTPVHRLRNFLFGNKAISLADESRETNYQVDQVKIGDYALGAALFDSAPEKPDAKAFHDLHAKDLDRPQGVLGTALFLGAPCVIDYAAMEIRIHPGGVPDLDTYARLPTRIDAEYRDGGKSIRIDVNLGGDPLTAWVDTAGPTELYLPSAYVRRHGLYDRFTDYVEGPYDLAAPGRGGFRVVRMKDLYLGTIHFDEINVQLADPDHDDQLNSQKGTQVEAIVGRGLLKQMSVAFQDRTVFLKPNAAFTPVSGPYVPPAA